MIGYVPTATGLSAIHEAEREARSRDAEVLVVNVVSPLGYIEPTAADDRNLDAVLAQLGADGVKCALRQFTDETKSPAEVLLDVAREVDAGLIVLGLHQRSWLAKRVLGSTARDVAPAAPCSVLVVPDVDPHGRRSRLGDGRS